MEVAETLLDSSGFSECFRSCGKMRITVTVFVILISTYLVNASVLDPVIENVVHLKASKPPSGVAGIWKKKTIWKPRWVKEWKSAKVMKPVWRKVWSPVQIREWVPIPKPPPGWDSASTPLAPLHPQHQKTPLRDSQPHDSFPLHSATDLPLWDPVPYPESQQPPPPPPFPQPSHNAGGSCSKGGCDNSPSHSFNHQQILEILGPRYQAPEQFPNPEYSETVNHLTRIPPEGGTWGPPPLHNFPGLPEFLIPPKTLQLTNPQTNPNPPAQPSGFQNAPRWTPLPPENNLKGHFITKAPEHPYKFQFPDVELRGQNNTANTQSNDLKGQPNLQNQNATRTPGDFIQEAQLVGEYHYSEFDLPNVKPNPPQQGTQNQERVKQNDKSKPGEGAPRGATNQRPPEQTKQRQTKQPQVTNPQGGPHIQKKHISNPSQNVNNFHKQEALIKEIFPIFKPLPNRNHTQHPLHQSTKLEAVNLPQNSSNQPLKDIYPIYESPQNLPPNFFPPNHRFLLPSDSRQEKPHSVNNSDTESDERPLSNHKPETPKPENPSSHKTNSIQLVFATTPVDYNKSLEEVKRTTTTEPYEVVFSSSLQSTTETVTKSPVIIVTPIGLKS